MQEVPCSKLSVLSDGFAHAFCKFTFLSWKLVLQKLYKIRSTHGMATLYFKQRLERDPTLTSVPSYPPSYRCNKTGDNVFCRFFDNYWRLHRLILLQSKLNEHH